MNGERDAKTVWQWARKQVKKGCGFLAVGILCAMMAEDLYATSFADIEVSDTASFATGNANGAIVEILNDGLLYSIGDGVSPGGLPSILENLEGSRMFWYPKKFAFRAGLLSSANSDYWNDDQIGNASVAFGADVKAEGYGSLAGGYLSRALGGYSTALGYNNEAGVAGSSHSAIALGAFNEANGTSSIAFGLQNQSTETAAIALGVKNESAGLGSVTLGVQNQAHASGSVTLGVQNQAFALGSVVVGIAGVANGDANNILDSNVVFAVGIGTLDNDPEDGYEDRVAKNALTIYRSGKIEVEPTSGFIRIAPAGDLSMGSYTAEP